MSNNSKAAETIREKGVQAFYQGQSIDSCPYTTIGAYGKKYRRIWLGGFIDARDGYAPRANNEVELTNAR